MPATYQQPDSTPASGRIARQERLDSLTLGQFDRADFSGRKYWAWCTHDQRREKEQEQVPVLPPEGTRRRLWRRSQPGR
jgi:hypothetical protein